MMTDVNQTCGDHFAIYANIKLLCCASENKRMLYVNYKKKKRERDKRKKNRKKVKRYEPKEMNQNKHIKENTQVNVLGIKRGI